MARSNGIILLMTAPLCAAALFSAPARAEDSLFDRPAAQSPAAEAPKPAADPASKAALKTVPKPKHVAAKHKPASKPEPEPEPEPAEAASVPAASAPIPPVVVQEPEPQSAFGQQMPRQSLINRFMNPASESGEAGGQVGPDGKPAAPAAPEEDTLPNGMPKKFLLNRLFDSSALEAPQPGPRSFMAQAQTPAAEPAPANWWESATKSLGLSGKQETPSGNLPPVTVTAPAGGRSAAPPPAAPAAPPPAAPGAAPPPSEPSWFDRATNAIGLGGGDKTVPDYSERPKLAVPHNLDALPPPSAREERRVQPPPNAEALTKPPPGYLDKVQGADGKVSGFTEKDEGKKGWFNWF
jgi:hypothetical protein